ncbi:DNA-binding protein [Pseudomonas aeruginosa]
MSKGGVTFTEVKNAVEQLRKQGINPSVDNILKFIGHGSKTTIHKHLKALLRSERGLLGELGKL